MWQPEERRIFVSHCSAYRATGEEFQKLVRKYPLTPGQAVPHVFLSSDASSIPTGEEWLARIMDELKSCTHFVALIAGEGDWKNPWISLETAHFMGRQYAQSKDNARAPLIFAFGDLIDKATAPLNNFQVIDGRDADRIQNAVLSLRVGPWLGDCVKDFASFFKTPPGARAKK